MHQYCQPLPLQKELYTDDGWEPRTELHSGRRIRNPDEACPKPGIKPFPLILNLPTSHNVNIERRGLRKTVAKQQEKLRLWNGEHAVLCH